MSDIIKILETLLSSEEGKKGSVILIAIVTLFMVFCVKAMDILIEKLKKKLSKPEKIKGFIDRGGVNVVVQNLINTALASIGGDRIHIFEFSNTLHNIVLLPFHFMSCTYEAYRPGLEGRATLFQNINISLYSIFLTKLLKNSFLYLDFNSKMSDLPPSSYDLMKTRESTQSLYVHMNSPISKIPIGFIVYDSESKTDFTDKTINLLRSLADQIGMLLSIREL